MTFVTEDESVNIIIDNSIIHWGWGLSPYTIDNISLHRTQSNSNAFIDGAPAVDDDENDEISSMLEFVKFVDIIDERYDGEGVAIETSYFPYRM